MIAGCFKEEAPIRLKQRTMHSKYVKLNCNNEENNRIYFDFSTEQYHLFPNHNWNLAFDTRTNGSAVRINLTMADFHLYQHSDTNFNVAEDLVIAKGIEVLDSVNDWYGDNAIKLNGNKVSPVYVYYKESLSINGISEKIKFQITHTNDLTYTIKFLNSSLLGAKVQEVTIDKNLDYSFVYFSFDKGGKIIYNEPIKADWDVVFTQYRDMIKFDQDNQYYPYQVLGTLINPFNTEVYEFEGSTNFNEINSSHIKEAEWCRISNTIGYDWKYYSLSNGIYTTDTSKVWLIKDSDQKIYKLRFINYYNSTGKSGYPSFEYAEF